jgi:hypothetical protein
MPKKTPIASVTCNPYLAKTPSKNTTIDNPLTGTPLFGFFPEITNPRISFESGPIYLRYGEHFGANRGYGLVHIWQEHFRFAPSAMAALPDAAKLLNKVLQPRSTIHYEYGLGRAANRTTVLRNTAGIAILEKRLDGLNKVFYAIVTAFPGRNANGPVIGAILKNVLDPT